MINHCSNCILLLTTERGVPGWETLANAKVYYCTELESYFLFTELTDNPPTVLPRSTLIENLDSWAWPGWKEAFLIHESMSFKPFKKHLVINVRTK